MLDTFEILTTTGVVLWSKSYAPVSPSVINNLINDVFIEERTVPGVGVGEDISAAINPPYKSDQHTLKWTTVKELGLIFVVSLVASPGDRLEFAKWAGF
jgi:signal recognition particle receptor subunit alpha